MLGTYYQNLTYEIRDKIKPDKVFTISDIILNRKTSIYVSALKLKIHGIVFVLCYFSAFLNSQP